MERSAERSVARKKETIQTQTKRQKIKIKILTRRRKRTRIITKYIILNIFFFIILTQNFLHFLILIK
jgi:hypothetical protein